jgi:hypothetical protein
MGETNGKVVKNGFPKPKPAVSMRRGVVWCGNGCQRFLIAFFLGHVDVEFGCKFKVDRAQEGAMSGIPTNFLLWQKSFGRLNGRNSPRGGQIHPKRSDLGA